MIKKKNPCAVIALSIVTFGIYWLFWYYSINKQIKEHSKGQISFSPGMALLAQFIPIAGQFSWYNTAKRIQTMKDNCKDPDSSNPVVALLFAIFLPFGIYTYMVQSAMNSHLLLHSGGQPDAADNSTSKPKTAKPLTIALAALGLVAFIGLVVLVIVPRIKARYGNSVKLTAKLPAHSAPKPNAPAAPVAPQPDAATTLYNNGVALAAAGKNEDAIKAYDQAIQMKPDFDFAWASKGLALINLGKYNDALVAYDKAIQIKPDFANAWDGKGYTLAKLKKYGEALKANNKAISLDPGFANAYYDRAITYLLEHRNQNALKDLAKAFQLDPTSKATARTDKDLIPLWNNPRFKKLAAS